MDVVVGEGAAVQVEGDRAGFTRLQPDLREGAQFPGRAADRAAVATYTWTTCWPARAPVLLTATEAQAVSGPVAATVRSLTAKVV